MWDGIAHRRTLEQAHDIETNLEERVRQAAPTLKDVVVRRPRLTDDGVGIPGALPG